MTKPTIDHPFRNVAKFAGLGHDFASSWSSNSRTETYTTQRPEATERRRRIRNLWPQDNNGTHLHLLIAGRGGHGDPIKEMSVCSSKQPDLGGD
jgi:hypothetical protein